MIASRVSRFLGAVAVLAALLGPGAASAIAHAELVASTPADGAVVAGSPAEIRLVFSEPIEGGFSTLDLAGPDGVPILTAAGTRDPADEHVLVAATPTLGEGVHTVSWRALSQIDGHTDVGKFSFTVVSPETSAAPSSSPAAGPVPVASPSSGHRDTLATQGRSILYGGVLLAFGLALVAWVVLEPSIGRIPQVVVRAIGIGLLVGAIGSGLMLLSSGLALPGPTGRPDLVGYATMSRPGLLLLARVGIGLAAGIAVLAMVRLRRDELALDTGALAATAMLGITVAAGHAATFSPPITIAAWFVHAAAAGVWLAGVGCVAGLAARRGPDIDLVGRVVPRYSALALVAVALLALTGAYQAWIEIAGMPSIDDPYERLLVVKVVVATVALALGLANYLDGGRFTRLLGGLGRRATVETFIGLVVVVLTANLATTPPPASSRLIELGPAHVAADAPRPDVRLLIGPARPGPNRFVAEPGGGASTGVPESLRLIDEAGEVVAEAPFRPMSGAAVTYSTDAVPISVGPWRADVVVAGGVTPPAVYLFVMGPEGVSEGRATPPIDLGLVVGLILIVTGLFAVALARAGRTLPRTEPIASRIALTGGGLVGLVIGLMIVFLGPTA
jgi:copper transport protein